MMNINWNQFRKSIILLWIISVCTVSYLSVMPQVELPFNFRWSDKLCHSLAYFWLSALPFIGFTRGNKALICALLMIPLGIGLEFIQGFIPGRFFSVSDMIANGLGAVAGIFFGQRLHVNRGGPGKHQMTGHSKA